MMKYVLNIQGIQYRIVSAYRNKFEEYGKHTRFVQTYGDLTFPEFVDLIIAESEEYGKDNLYKFNHHWRPFYLARCDFCNVPFKGQVSTVMTQGIKICID